MSDETCPELEQLFVGLSEGDEEMQRHAESCPACAAIVEEHRQLEKDLLRLTDPLPPANFVHRVMAKVEKAPVPLRRELWTGFGIFAVALAGTIAFIVRDPATAGAFGTTVASALLNLKSSFVATGAGIKAIWATAALPITSIASASFVFVLFAFRRLTAPSPQESRVSA